MTTPLPRPAAAPLDRRAYRLCTLPNALRVALVHDAQTRRAAAALRVAVGHLNDPPELLGLSHFVEHLVHLGTEKYPDEEAYDKHIADHGGSKNACTSDESTSYYFSLAVPDAPSPRGSAGSVGAARGSPLRTALDMFAQFFVAPLFAASATGRELDAVESEFQDSAQDDGCRTARVWSATLNAAHPMSRFAGGNAKSLREIPERLGIDVRDACIAHHEKYYSANLMTLSVVSPYDLDVVHDWVVAMFSAVPNKHRPRPHLEYEHIPLFPADQAGRVRLFTSTVLDTRELELSWQMPCVRKQYRSKPWRLCSALLGHEGEGSLLSNLKRRGLADELGAYAHFPCAGHDLFDLSVTLTEKGARHVDDIIQTVFAFLSLCRQSLPAWLHGEMRRMGDIRFQFQEPCDPLDMAFSLVQALQLDYVDPRDCIRCGFILDQVDEAASRAILECLTPRRVNVSLMGKYVGEAANETEEWYGTSYGKEFISQEDVRRWEEAAVAVGDSLSMPKRNAFIPDDLSLIAQPIPHGEQDEEPPVQLKDTGHMEVWHKLDRQFRQPTVWAGISFKSALIRSNVREYELARMFFALVCDDLTEFCWDARRAGIYYSTREEYGGFSIYFFGYNDKISLLVEKLLGQLKNFSADPVRFSDVFDERRRSLEDCLKLEAYEVAGEDAEDVLAYRNYLISDHIACMNNGSITLQDVDEFSRVVMRQLRSVMFVHGNVDEDWVRNLAFQVQNELAFSPLASMHVPNGRAVQLPTNFEVLMRRKCPNLEAIGSATHMVFQIGMTGVRPNEMKCALTAYFLVSLLEPLFFKELRTVQQLGYIVSIYERTARDVVCVQITIQGSKSMPEDVCLRVEDFLAEYRSTFLEALTEADLKPHIDSLVSQTQEPDRSANLRARKLWGEIVGKYFCFDRASRLVEAARSITCRDIVDLFDRCIARSAPERRRLTSLVYGSAHEMHDDRQVVDAVSAASGGREVQLLSVDSKAAFQDSMALWPSPKGISPFETIS